MIVASFLTFLAIFTLIGLSSSIKKQKNTKDYLLAGCNVPPWLVSLAAVATNQSGFMFIGMIGYTYASGLQSIWVFFAWMFGDFIASLFVHRRLREMTTNLNAETYAGVLSNWTHQDFKWLRFLSAFLIIAFLGTYAAAQLSAGSKALHVMFEWDYSMGAIIGSVIVVAYCFAGGIRASIWTNAAQSFVMIIAMAVMCITALEYTDGIGGFFERLYNVSDTYMNWFPENMIFGPVIGAALVLGGWTAGGFGVVGQPHIMMTFMTMDDPKHMKKVRYYYYGWYTLFGVFVMGAGFATRLLLPETESFDPELALPSLAMMMLPDFLVGMVLAGLFAATMSTADSQIIACTGAITRDLGIGRNNYFLTKLATVCVTATALVIALVGDDSVFTLVLIAWSGLGAAFAPLLTVYVFGGRPKQGLAIAMMAVGFFAMLLWRMEGPSGDIYEILPGIIAGFATYGVGKLLGLVEDRTQPIPGDTVH